MICAALLAAGSSARLGQPKQLVRFRGVPLVGHVAAAMAGAGADRCAAVLGTGADAVRAALREHALVELVNEQAAEGIASSIRAAVVWARDQRAERLLLCLCDQPFVTSDHLRTLLAASRAPEDAVASRYAGKLGAPAVFGADWFDRLAGLRGDHGAGKLLGSAEHVLAVDFPLGAFDVDTPADLARLATGD